MKQDVMDTAGCLQLWLGNVLVVKQLFVLETFDDESTEGILLVDVSNAFNSLNCRIYAPG